MNYQKMMHTVPKYETLRSCLFDTCKRHGNAIAYRQIESKTEETAITYSQLLLDVKAIGTALLCEGFSGSHVALIGECSVEWMESYLAIVCGVGVAVPVDRELNEEMMTLQLNRSDADAVFVSGAAAAKVLLLMKNCPRVKKWFLMRPAVAKCETASFSMLQMLKQTGQQLLSEGDESYDKQTVHGGDLCDIIFTSGTTGANKGVMLSHQNITTVLRGSQMLIDCPSKTMSVLPINHAYEKNCNVLGYLSAGLTVCINDTMAHVVPNIKRFEPGLSIMVPAILEIIERKIRAEAKRAGLEKSLTQGIVLSRALRILGVDRREQLFGAVLKIFGPNLRHIVSGGAPLKEETRKFFDAIGVAVSNGYGISECGPLVAANFSGYQRPGSVGYVMPGCEVRIDRHGLNRDGEIQVRGDNVMMGYYRDTEATMAVFTDDGWLKTGDLGHMDRDGFLYVSGRLKNLIILANGKNISPEEIEETISARIPYVAEVVVYADEDNTGIYASCFLDPDYVRENHVEQPHDYLMADIVKLNQSLPSFKRIRDVLISGEEFEKTTTKKIRRFQVKKLQDMLHTFTDRSDSK